MSPSAVVMGGSLGGLNAAIALRDCGLDVEVYERSRVPLEGKGAGIVLHPATVQFIDGVRTTHWSRISASADRLRYLDIAGEVIHESHCSYRFSSYYALHSSLLTSFGEDAYHLGREVVGVDPTDDDVTIRTADGATRRCDVLVCADGVHSTARRILLPEVDATYAGYVGWRGTVAEGDLSASTFALLDGTITYHLLDRSHILAYPIPSRGGSLEPGHRLTNWVWYRNLDADGLQDLLIDHSGRRRQMSVGPGEVRDHHLDQLRAATDLLPPPLAEMVRRTHEPFVQAVHDVSVERLVFGRACLLGDAAFVVRPHLAAGTAKAADDACALGKAVRRRGGDISRGLRSWESGQLALGRRLVERARWIGYQLQQDGTWPVGTPLPFGLHEVGDSTLSER